MPKVYFIDVTNRDGVQTSRISLAKLQKTMVNIYLGQMGVFQSEVGFPYVRHEQNYVKGNLELARHGVMGQLRLSGWCRAMPQDVLPSLTTGIEYLNISASTSDQMITHKYQGRRDRNRVIAEMVEAAKIAVDGGIKGLGVNAEDASRTDMEYLVEFALAAKEAGAGRIRYCDTLGYDSPLTSYERVKTLAQRVGLPIELHCHNDLGMAVANSVMGALGALEAGHDAYINTTVNGIGERAGQADLLSCVLAINFAAGMEAVEIADDINLKLAVKLSRYAADAFGLPIPINQPGVGANAFAHESGIHADGTLKNRRNYELYDFETLGLDEAQVIPTGRIITTGEYGGLAGMRYVYERLGITFPNDQAAQEVLELVQVANAHTQHPLSDDELRLIATHPAAVRTILTIFP